MKFIVIKLLFLANVFVLLSLDFDILNNKQHLVIYSDGINQSYINSAVPILNSWRQHKIELTNICKIIECRYDYLPNTVNRISASKCIIENNKNCKFKNEQQAIFKFEELISNSDYINKIELGGENFGMIANSKDEEGIVFQFGSDKGMDSCLKEKQKEFLKKLHI